MSIESNLKRIADALEVIAKSMEKQANPLVEAPAIATPVKTPPIASTHEDIPAPPVTPTQPVHEVVPTVVVPPPTQPVTTASVTVMTAKEMNDALVTEFKRLGGREKIDVILTSFGITSVNDCPAEKQAEVLAAIRALV